jgi:hypothetical protein
LTPEQWGSPLVQDKYQGEMACDKIQHNNNNNNNNKNKKNDSDDSNYNNSMATENSQSKTTSTLRNGY